MKATPQAASAILLIFGRIVDVAFSVVSVFCRSRRAHDIATSDETSLDGGQPPHPPPAPANIRSQEDSILPERLLRRKARLPEQAFIHRDVSALAFRSYHVIIQFKHRNVTRMGHNLNLFREFLGMSLGIFLF